MDYLDELNDPAMQALTELGADISPTTNTTAPYPHSSRPARRRRVPISYLLQLESPLSTPRQVADALALPRVPRLETGTGEDGDASFCQLDQDGIEKLGVWAAEACPDRRFTAIRVGMAHKDDGELPILGRDPTLPQYRPSTVSCCSTSLHYPMYYFFYGTLADTERLARLFDIPVSKVPRLLPATLLDGRVRTWAGKYRALVDCPGGQVEGWVYPVMSAEQEDALRMYEGDSYEVVRGRVVLESEVVGKGLKTRGLPVWRATTFRFSGFEDELSG